MRIVHVYRDLLDGGGVPHLTRRLIEAQSSQGHEILAVSAARSGEKAYPSAGTGPIQHLEVTSMPASLRRLRARVTDFSPDVAHVAGLTIPSQQFWTYWIRRADVPFVVSPHGVLNPLGMQVRFGEKKNSAHRLLAKKLFRALFDGPLLRQAAAAHAECEFEARLARFAGARRVFTLPIGIDDEWTNASVAEGRELHDPVTFLHLGRFDVAQKGLDLVLKAVAELSRMSAPRRWRVILAGSPVAGSTEELRGAIRTLAIDDYVELRGPVWDAKEKEALWREADFFLSVFRYGGMPRATAEALGNGLPLLASRESNWGDWVRSEQMGAMAGLTTQSVVDAVEKLAAVDPANYRDMARNAFDFALRHSWDNVARATVDEYAEASGPLQT